MVKRIRARPCCSTTRPLHQAASVSNAIQAASPSGVRVTSLVRRKPCGCVRGRQAESIASMAPWPSEVWIVQVSAIRSRQ